MSYRHIIKTLKIPLSKISYFNPIFPIFPHNTLYKNVDRESKLKICKISWNENEILKELCHGYTIQLENAEIKKTSDTLKERAESKLNFMFFIFYANILDDRQQASQSRGSIGSRVVEEYRRLVGE